MTKTILTYTQTWFWAPGAWPQATGHEKLGNENDTYVHSDKKLDDHNDTYVHSDKN